MGIGAEVVYKTVSLRIVVDIPDEVLKVALMSHLDAAKSFLEEAPGSAIRFVDGFCVTAEQVGETPRRARSILRPRGLRSDADEEMEVVFEQAVGKRIDNRSDVVGIAIQKERIVTRFSK